MTNIDVEAVDDAGGDDTVDHGGEHGGGSSDPSEGPADIPVEATDDATPEGVDAPDYVLYGGKGGVGKTTMAAATALASARGDAPTLVVSTDPAHSLSDTLGVDVPPEPTRIRDDVPLYAAEIDPEAAGEEGMFGQGGDGEGPLGGLGGMGGMGGMAGMPGMGGADDGEGFDPFGDDDVPGPGMGTGGGAMPGADEAAAMRQLLEYLDDPRFDRVVVDTAPTGHTLRLLQLPEMLDSMVGRIAKLRERFSGMMDGMKGMFGAGADPTDAPGLDELQERIERLRRVLQDPERTDFRVVMVPEEMSVVESERLVSRLGEFGIPVQTLVVNRVMEDLREVADVEASEAFEDWVVSPSLEDCEFCQRRWKVQQNALGRATDLFRGRDVKRVPLLADEVQGERALAVVAACLA
ncbi:ArsA family ATPase [Halobium salinum]|uniref:ArsA family ATPase n=1 Tax=Halobium salinum TaxID=1364940 RepID=A0ABD5P8P5_9EURY